MAIDFTPNGTQGTQNRGIQVTEVKPKGFFNKLGDFLGIEKFAKATTKAPIIGDITGDRQLDVKMDDIRNRGLQTAAQLSQLIAKNRKEGKDTTKLEETLSSLQKTNKVFNAQTLSQQTRGGLTGRQVVGSAVSTASLLPVGFGGAKAAQSLGRGALGKASIEGAISGGAGGALSGLGFGLQDKKATAGDVAKQAALGGIIGSGAGAILPPLSLGAGKIAGKLGRTAKIGKQIATKEVSEQTTKAVESDLRQNLFTTTKSTSKQYDDFVQGSKLKGKSTTPEAELIKRGLFPEVVDGKADFSKSIPVLEAETDELEKALDASLQRYEGLTKDRAYLLNEVEKSIKQDTNLLQSGRTDTVRQQAIKVIDDVLKEKGKGVLSIPEIQSIKRTQYNQSRRFGGGATPDYTTSDAASVVARAFKNVIENEVDDVAVKEINRELGNLADLQNFVGKVQGNAVKGGRLGLYAGRVIGSAAGSGSWIGSVLGAMGGDAVARVLQKNAVVGPLKRMYIKRLSQDYSNPVLIDVVRYLDDVEKGIKPKVPEKVIQQMKDDLIKMLPAPADGQPRVQLGSGKTISLGSKSATTLAEEEAARRASGQIKTPQK